MNKILKGEIISLKMNNTAIVVVERKFRHPLYRKVIVRHKKYKVQNDGKHEIGETVSIIETRPISKEKHFRILENKD